AIDERTYNEYGVRNALTLGLERIAPARPKAVAVDVILAARAAGFDDRVEQAFAHTPHLVLASLLLGGKTWDYPLKRFRRWSVGVGHVHSEPDEHDQVMRKISLEKETDRTRHWALSLEAFRVSRGAEIIAQEPAGDVHVGTAVIPAKRTGDGRLMRVRFTDNPPIPRVSIRELMDHPELASRFAGKVVFVGDMSLNSDDRKMTPLGEMPGVLIHAQAFETMAQRLFLT